MGTCSRNSRSKRHDPATQFSFDVSGSLNEFQSADFGDRRLTDRLIQIEDALGGAPAESIPNACDSWASTKATYRFCDNECVKPKEILSAHRQAHHSRLSETDELLVVSDTSYLTFPRHPAKEGLGDISSTAIDVEGIKLHTSIGIHPDTPDEWGHRSASADRRLA